MYICMFSDTKLNLTWHSLSKKDMIVIGSTCVGSLYGLRKQQPIAGVLLVSLKTALGTPHAWKLLVIS